MAGNLVGVGLQLFLALFFVFSTYKILLVGIRLFDSIVFVVVVSFFLVVDLVDGRRSWTVIISNSFLLFITRWILLLCCD
jgi:hypothetical protein